jgi:uncharacterized secreted repeat protein (TIGR03808 family)
MPISRRSFVTLSAAGLGAQAALSRTPAEARIVTPHAGALDAAHFGVDPGVTQDQSAALQRAIDEAALRGMPLFLPPGRYLVRDIALPSGLYLSGVPGRSQLLFAGGDTMLVGRDAEQLTLAGLTVAAAGNRFTDPTPGLVYLRSVTALTVDGCRISGGTRSGLSLEYCAGRITNCDIWGCHYTGIFSLDATGLDISGNNVRDCGNNGIQVWRSRQGEDGTILTQNRILGIAARDGGSGQNGNGIVVFRAGSVIVAHNRIADCAFSAVRSNAGSNCQILGNSCARLGEKALYAEFGFQGAVIANNIVDGAEVGVSITNFDQGGRLAVCAGNIIRNIRPSDEAQRPGSGGTGIFAEADTVVANNVVEGVARAGLALGWGPALRDVSATGNIVRDAHIGITVSVAPGAGGAVIADNLISQTRAGAIVGMEWAKAATGDLAEDGAARFPKLRVERNYVS